MGEADLPRVEAVNEQLPVSDTQASVRVDVAFPACRVDVVKDLGARRGRGWVDDRGPDVEACSAQVEAPFLN